MFLRSLDGRCARPILGTVLTFAVVAFGSVVANAQSITEPEVESGQRKLEVFSAFQSGFNGGAAGDVRDLQSFAYHHALTHFWLAKAILSAERPVQGDYKAAAFTVENVFEIQNAKKAGGIGYGWFTSVAAGLDDEQTNVVTFGPIIRLGAGDTSLILNPFFEQTFGRNRDDGIAFVYGWQLKHQVREGFAIAVEGFGTLPDVTGGGGPEEHRIGPLLAFEVPLADKRSLSFEAGWLFGLTEATPDHTIKFQVTYAY